jgi:putative transposase
VTFCGR